MGSRGVRTACFREVYEKSLFSKQKVLQMLGAAPSEHPRTVVGDELLAPGPMALGSSRCSLHAAPQS